MKEKIFENTRGKKLIIKHRKSAIILESDQKYERYLTIYQKYCKNYKQRF